jgi:hypothetical protein
VKCPAGTYGIAERSVGSEFACADCPPGYECPEGAATYELYPCPAGGYCPGKTGKMTKCPAGFYNDLLHRYSIADCKLCLMG